MISHKTSESILQPTIVDELQSQQIREEQKSNEEIKSTQEVKEEKEKPPKCTPKRILFCVVVILFGFTSIGSTAYFALLKNKYGLEPQELNSYTFFTTFSMVLKPAYGLLTDEIYICGTRRKPYIIICGLLAATLYMIIGFVDISLICSSLLMFAINLLLSIINSVAEAIMIEDSHSNYAQSQAKSAGNNVSLFFLMEGGSLLVISYLTGVLMDRLELCYIFLICGSICAAIVLCGVLFNEPVVRKAHIPVKEHFRNLWHFMKRRTIYLPIVFIFLCGLTPSTYDALTYFYMNILKFNFEMLGRVNIMSNIGYIGGIIAYNRYFKAKPFKSVVIITTFIITAFGLMQLVIIFHLNRAIGIPDIYAVMILSLFNNSFMEINMLPLLTLSCMLCPKNNEAFIFETIIGLKCLSYSIAYKSGGCMMAILSITSTDFSLLWVLILVSSLFPLISVVFLLITPIKSDYSAEQGILRNVTNRPHLNALEESITLKKSDNDDIQ